MYQTLISESILLIGERSKSRIVWVQLYDATHSIEEEDLRELLHEIKIHILKRRIESGSARKFLDGKLLFHEILDQSHDSKIYCLFTREMKLGTSVKKSMKAIAQRGGSHTVYSAKRFFSEMIDLLSEPEALDMQSELSVDEILETFESFKAQTHNINELGQMISILSANIELDFFTLEKIYFHVYESIQSLKEEETVSDPDEFLDACYIVAESYRKMDNFHLALELYKQIIPLAINNQRYELETACRIKQSVIYKRNFPKPGQFILDTLSPISTKRLKETTNTNREIYYCLFGFAHDHLNDQKQALSNYNMAINQTDVNISSPKWIAEAYDYCGQVAHNNYFLMEASRQYLTAATIAFSSGDLALADNYRNNAATTEMHTGFSIIHTALTFRMEGNYKDAEYRAWDALRLIIKSFIHAKPQNYSARIPQAIEILDEAEVILNFFGKRVINSKLISAIRNTIEKLQIQTTDTSNEVSNFEELSTMIESNIPIPPPTFMLLTLDGRLIIIGKILDDMWVESDIEGVILSGILSAIMSLITEVTGKTSLRTVDAGSFQIMIEHSENIAAVLLTDRDIPEFRHRLIQILNFIDEDYGQMLKFWDGRIDIFGEMKEQVVKLFTHS